MTYIHFFSKNWYIVCNVKNTRTQCRGIGPHLAGRGKSHGFSRVAAGTWGTFSSYDGGAHSKREFV